MKHLALLVASMSLLGCVGDVTTSANQGPRPDAFVQVTPDAYVPPPDSGPAAGCVDRTATIAKQYIHTGNAGAVGTMAGAACATAGCHMYGNTNGQAQPFIFAGTVFKPGTTEPDVGLTVIITPDDTTVPPIQVTTNDAGNFYVVDGRFATGAGTAPITALPASAAVTACPSLHKGHQATTGRIRAGTTPGNGGNCNACHTAPPDGIQAPINLPL